MNSRITGILGDLTAFLTIIAVMPYEFGAIADLFPPDAKKWIAGAAAVATVALRLIKRVQSPPPLPTESPIVKP